MTPISFHVQNSFEMGHDLNGKTKTINLLEEKQCNLRVGKDLTIKEKKS